MYDGSDAEPDSSTYVKGSTLGNKQNQMNKKIKKMPRPTAAAAGYDSDEERDNAHRMFIDDLQALRKLFIQTIDDQVRIQEDMQANFNHEREFFLQSAEQSQANARDL